MAVDATASAFSAQVAVKSMPYGVQTQHAEYDNADGAATITAGANNVKVTLMKIPHGAWITSVVEAHSSGAATFPVALGIEVTSGSIDTSAFAAANTLAASNVTSPLKLPYKVSCPDTQATQFAKILAFGNPGTSTTELHIAVDVQYCMDEVRP